MKYLPSAFRMILNIIFYIIYSIISLILTWFILTRVFDVIISTDSSADKIWYIVVVFVFIITLIFRKFFYIPLKNN